MGVSGKGVSFDVVEVGLAADLLFPGEGSFLTWHPKGFHGFGCVEITPAGSEEGRVEAVGTRVDLRMEDRFESGQKKRCVCVRKEFAVPLDAPFRATQHRICSGKLLNTQAVLFLKWGGRQQVSAEMFHG